MSGAAASSYTVNTQADSNDGACTLALCSLRDAIVAANAGAGADKIAFDIEPAGPWTIKPTSQLPIVTDPVTIDGSTEPGTPPNTPGIELDGESAGGSNGLEIDAGSSTVRGLVINRFAADGIFLQTGTLNTIVGNYLGTNATGQASSPNGHGIEDNSGNNLIGGTTAADRNVISGNSLGGVHLIAAGSTVEGNYIGTDATGTFAVGNGDEGILVQAQNSTIGGTAPGAGNVIAGSTIVTNGHGDGIGLYAPNNLVQGNLIGTNATGTVALPNAQRGILINGVSGNTVGGTTAAARNVISGNAGSAILVGNGGDTNTIEGNYLGLQPDGTTPLGNGYRDSDLRGSRQPDRRDGRRSRERISSNVTFGILLDAFGTASSTTIQGNLIGTDKTGTLDRGNGSSGILISPARRRSSAGLPQGPATRSRSTASTESRSTAAPATRSAATRSSPTTASRTPDSESIWTAPWSGRLACFRTIRAIRTPVRTRVRTSGDLAGDEHCRHDGRRDAQQRRLDDVSPRLLLQPELRPVRLRRGAAVRREQGRHHRRERRCVVQRHVRERHCCVGDVVSATATDPVGNTSGFAQCATVNGGGVGSLTGAVQPIPRSPTST